MTTSAFRAAVLATAMLGVLAGAASAKDESAPDWPCVQRKVADLSASQVWDGPPLDGLPAWKDDPAISKLVPVLTARRVAIAEAEQEVKKFAEALPDAERDSKLTLLFSGLFETMAAERRTIIGGIERFNRRQKELATALETKGTKLAELEKAATQDGKNDAAAKQLTDAQEAYDWDTRIFKERQDNLPLACEIPVIIDERLFGLARTIREHMKS